MKIYGTATISIGKQKSKNYIYLDFVEEKFVMHILEKKDSKTCNFVLINDWFKKKIKVTDINLYTNYGILYMKQLPSHFLQSIQGSGYSVDDSFSNIILDYNNNHSGYTKIVICTS